MHRKLINFEAGEKFNNNFFEYFLLLKLSEAYWRKNSPLRALSSGKRNSVRLSCKLKILLVSVVFWYFLCRGTRNVETRKNKWKSEITSNQKNRKPQRKAIAVGLKLKKHNFVYVVKFFVILRGKKISA